MILLSIVSVAVVPSWNSAQANLNHQAELLVRNLNHAQVLAMHRATSLTINFSSTTYSVSDAGGIITDPATGTPFTISLDEGVTFSTWSDFTVDSLGRPNSGVVLASTPFTQTLLGGNRSKVVTVSPLSGVVTITEG